jgi:hypothetical protein
LPPKALLTRETKSLFLRKPLKEFAKQQRDERLKWSRWKVVDGVSIPILWPSSAGGCRRQACYDIQGYKPVPEDVQSLMRMYDGTAHEDNVAHWLKLMGYEMQDLGLSIHRTFKREGKPYYALHAKLDGKILIKDPLTGEMVWAVWENKGLSTFTARYKDPTDAVNPTYRDQARIYMKLTGLDQTVFTIKDKNTSELHFYILRQGPKGVKRIMKRMRRIARACHRKKLMPRDFDPWDSKCRSCNWCRHKKRCKSGVKS